MDRKLTFAIYRMYLHQVGSAGVRVIELEGHKPGGIFGRPATEPGRMQWTVEQETTRVLVPDNPFAEATARGVRPAC